MHEWALAEAILASARQIAEQEQVNLIVMESHGRTNLTDVVLGSMAERVGQHAPCPVLVVQLPKEGN